MRFRTDCATASLLQRFVYVRARHLQSGKNREEQGAGNSGDQGEDDDDRVDLDVIEPRHIARTE